MPKCPKCSHFEEVARFCGKCGTAITQANSVEPEDIFSVSMTSATKKSQGPAVDEFPVDGTNDFPADDFLDNDSPEINFFDDDTEENSSDNTGSDNTSSDDIFDTPATQGVAATESEAPKLSPKEEKEAKKKAKNEEKKAQALEKQRQKELKAAQKRKDKEQRKKNRYRLSSEPSFLDYLACWILFLFWVGGGCAFIVNLYFSSLSIWVLTILLFFTPCFFWLVFRQKGFRSDLVLKMGFCGLFTLMTALLFVAYPNSMAYRFTLAGQNFQLGYFSVFLFYFLIFAQFILHYIFRNRFWSSLRFFLGCGFLYSLFDLLYGLAKGLTITELANMQSPLAVWGLEVIGKWFFYISPHFLLSHLFLPFFIISFGVGFLVSPFKKRWNLSFTYALFLPLLFFNWVLFLYSFKKTTNYTTLYTFLEPFYNHLQKWLSFIHNLL